MQSVIVELQSMSFAGILKWCRLPIQYGHRDVANTFHTLIYTPSSNLVRRIAIPTFEMNFDEVLDNVHSSVTLYGYREGVKGWSLQQKDIEHWKKTQSTERAVRLSIRSEPDIEYDENVTARADQRTFMNMLSHRITTVKSSDAASPMLKQLRINRRALRNILARAFVPPDDEDASSDDESALDEHVSVPSLPAPSSGNVTMLMGIAFSSTVYINKSRYPAGVTFAPVRDRLRCVELERRTGDRVITFADNLDIKDCEPERHFCGNFAARSIDRFVVFFRQFMGESKGCIKRIYLDYMRMSGEYITTAYRSVTELFWRMMVEGVIDNRTEIYVPNYESMRDQITHHNRVQAESLRVMPSIQIEIIDVSQNELYNVTESLWAASGDFAPDVNSIAGSSNHRDELTRNFIDDHSPFLKLRMSNGNQKRRNQERRNERNARKWVCNRIISHP